MAKQKVVVKVTMKNEKKLRKAMQIAVTLCGVESVAVVGTDKEQIAVTGEGVDSVKLTKLLRKSVGHSELVSVGPVEDKKPADDPQKPRFEYVFPPQYHGGQYMPAMQFVHDVPYTSCNIL